MKHIVSVLNIAVCFVLFLMLCAQYRHINHLEEEVEKLQYRVFELENKDTEELDKYKRLLDQTVDFMLKGGWNER